MAATRPTWLTNPVTQQPFRSGSPLAAANPGLVDAQERFRQQVLASGEAGGGRTNPNTGLGINPNVGFGTDLYGNPISLGNTLQSPLSPGGSFSQPQPQLASTGNSTFRSPLDVGDPSSWPQTYNIPPELSGGIPGTGLTADQPDLGAGSTAIGGAGSGSDPDLSGGGGSVPSGTGGDADLGGLAGTAAGLLGGSSGTQDKTALNRLAGFGVDWLVRFGLIVLGAGLVIIAAWALLRGETVKEGAVSAAGALARR